MVVHRISKHLLLFFVSNEDHAGDRTPTDEEETGDTYYEKDHFSVKV